MKNFFWFFLCITSWKEIYGQAQLPARPFRFAKDIRQGDYLPDQIVVKFRTTKGQVGNKVVASQSILRHADVQGIRSAFSAKNALVTNATPSPSNGPNRVDLSRVYRLHLKQSLSNASETAGQRLENIINQLRSDPDVEYAEPVYQYENLAVYTPDDPHQASQYHLETIRAYEAWQVWQGDPSTTIGISDWGFELSHEDLVGNIQYNLADPINGKDDDRDGYVDNYAGWNLSDDNNDLSGIVHGTQVAGLASASANNRKGIAGVGFECKFLPAKVQGKGGFRGMESIVYLADRGCKVINVSWGRRGGPSAYEEDIINYAAVQKDVVVVAAAGNDGNGGYYYPASYDNVISVAATNGTDRKWTASNYNDKVDISAPGQDLYGAAYGTYGGVGSGTSFASPLVAGAAGLVRSQYPHLNAQQVKQLLENTADDIDALNPGSAGMLGAGRLNVYRALTESYRRVVTLLDKGLVNAGGQGPLITGETSALWIKVNASAVQGNLVVTLATTSASVQITKDTAWFGAVSPAEAKDNRQHPFQLRLAPGFPLDSAINFTLTFTGDKSVERMAIQVVLNPSYQLLKNNQVSLALANDGRIGFESESNRKNANQNGFRYRNQDLLVGAGLMLGAGPTQVSNNIPGNAPGKDYDFSTLEALRPVEAVNKDIALAGSFSDTLANPSKIGLAVEYNPYTWQEGKYAIMEYRVKNVSGATISQLYAGIYANWDVQGAADNQTGWDAENQLGYVFNRRPGGLYAGVQLLTDQAVNYTGMDNTAQSPVQAFDGFTTAEKYAALSRGSVYPHSAAEATDVAHALAARLENLREGETRVVAFALLAGDNLADLRANAAAARYKFSELKRSPVPVVGNLSVCRDTPLVIKPANGTRFRLYNRLPLTQPVAEGALFQLTSTDTTTTYYVTNTDSLFESRPATVRIQPYRTTVDLTDTVINLDSAQTLQLTDKTEGAVWRRWDLGDGTLIRDSSAVRHAYKEAGEYTVQLTTLNAQGCEDTFTRLVTVTSTEWQPEPTIPSFIRLYPNPTQGVVHIETPADKSLTAARLYDALGRQATVAFSPAGEAHAYEVDFSDKSPGLYQLQVRIGGKWISRNILVR